MLDHLQTMAAYGEWANAHLYDTVAELSDADYRADRGAFFGSIHGTLNHILAVDRLWIGRLVDEDSGIRALDTVLFETFADLRAARKAEDKRIVEFMESLPSVRLDEVLSYHDTGGKACAAPVRRVLAHMFNHATHHRGQAHGLLSQVPVYPPPLDFIYFVLERS